jgi:hypothetical protein
MVAVHRSEGMSLAACAYLLGVSSPMAASRALCTPLPRDMVCVGDDLYHWPVAASD